MLAHRLKGQDVAVTVEERRGAPVAAVDHFPTGAQVLMPREREFRFPGIITPYRVGGFHDCFPSVAPCRCDGGYGVAFIPPFGDLWTRSWSFPQEEERIVSVVSGKPLPYRFQRTIRCEGNAVHFDYVVENVGRCAFPWLWSGRLWLPLDPDCRIVAPGADRVRIEEPAEESGTELPWPHATIAGRKIDLSRAQADGPAIKYFFQEPGEDRLSIDLPASRLRLGMCWDTRRGHRTFGVHLSGGNWPGGTVEPVRFVAIEVTSSPHENLTEAEEAGQAGRLEPGAQTSFAFTLDTYPLTSK